MGLIVYGNVLIEGMMAFAALYSLVLWWWRRTPALLLFAAFSALVGITTAATVSLMATDSVATAQRALNLRTTFGVLGYPLLPWLVCEIAGVRAHRVLGLATVACLLISAISALGVPVTGTVAGLDQARMPWGEMLTIVARDGARLPAALMYALLVTMLVYALYTSRHLWRRDLLASALIMMTAVATLVGAFMGVLTDVMHLRLPHFGVIQFVLWVPVLSLFLLREDARREERLVSSERRYRTLIESAPEAIVVLDVGAARFVEYNQKAVDLFGWPATELATKSPADVSPEFQPDGRRSADVISGHVRQVLEGETPFFEWTHRARDGRDIPCEVRLVRLSDPDRILIRGSTIDISDRRKLEAQLRQAQKMEAMGQLAAGVAHDFNNLLTVIDGYCGILLDKLPPEDPLHIDVTAIADAGNRAGALTQRLLAFSRRAPLAPRVVDINAVVRETEHILRRLIGDNIVLNVTLLPGGGYVSVDPGQLGQTVINLAVNARDALPNGGEVTIRTERAEPGALPIEDETAPSQGYVRLVVSDTGVGMPPDVKARIFEPFFTTKGVGRGTGLGLAVVHGFVKQSRGHAEVESAEGKGTTFSISLPLVEEVPDVAPRATREVGPRGTETILIVEDEEAVRHLLALGMTNYGFTVMTAGDGAEALRLADNCRAHIDVLVTDVVMPNLSGRDLADRLREQRGDLKVLFMSGYQDDGLLRDGLNEARESFLQKPFALQTFASKVREMLDQKLQ
jgi:PAS domain S-box-containing protein